MEFLPIVEREISLLKECLLNKGSFYIQLNKFAKKKPYLSMVSFFV